MSDGQEAAGAPPSRGAWTTVVLLSLIAVVSWLDRMILTLLVTPIQKDIGLTDTHFGLLLGLGFVVVFVLAGFPIATALDRGNRKRILSGAVVLWCLSTVASGFADSFELLLFLRAGVAVGEAALMPAAVSMISDHFPPERRRHPTSLLMAVNILGATGAFVIGGQVIAYFDASAGVYGLAGWRLSLIAVGLMGLPVLLLFMAAAREPLRSATQARLSSGVATLGHLRAHAPLYLCAFAGGGMLLMLAQGASAWLSTLMVRGYGFAPAETGPFLGLVFAPSSILGVIALPVLVGRRSGRALVLRILGLCLLASLLSAPFVLGAASGNLAALLATGAMALLGQGSMVALMALLIQGVTPAEMRARLMAIYYIFMNLIAGGLGPLAVAGVASALFQGPQALGGGLAVVAGIGVVCASGLFLIAYRWSCRAEKKFGE